MYLSLESCLLLCIFISFPWLTAETLLFFMLSKQHSLSLSLSNNSSLQIHAFYILWHYYFPLPGFIDTLNKLDFLLYMAIQKCFVAMSFFLLIHCVTLILLSIHVFLKFSLTYPIYMESSNHTFLF